MNRKRAFCLLTLLTSILAYGANAPLCLAQTPMPAQTPVSAPDQFLWTSQANASQPPLEYTYPSASSNAFPALAEAQSANRRPRDIAPFQLGSEWISDAQSGLITTNVAASIPLLKLGTPPPLIKIGFDYTELFQAEALALPDQLFQYTIGLSWIRPVNERWTIRVMLGVGFATDHANTSSDAWQFRGGAFALFRQTQSLTWTFGALATGRDDLPVLPAIGAVWQPNPLTRVDLLFPRPKVNFLIREEGARQQWIYLGFEINGNTWAIEEPGSIDDRLTYRDLRTVVGWESRPAAAGGRPFAIGRTLSLELGYAFSRELQFDSGTPNISLDDGWIVGLNSKF